jgi:hypothetical protein
MRLCHFLAAEHLRQTTYFARWQEIAAPFVRPFLFLAITMRIWEHFCREGFLLSSGMCRSAAHSLRLGLVPSELAGIEPQGSLSGVPKLSIMRKTP